MYRKTERQLPLENFYLPFSGELNPENRWVKLSKIIPWDVIEEKYASLFAKSGKGAPAKPVRMALGALIIKETLVLSDEELVNQMTENPYFQYFIGLPEFQKEAPFDPSMMVHFRKRLNGQVMQEINELICLEKNRKNRMILMIRMLREEVPSKKTRAGLLSTQHVHRRIFATRPIYHCSMKPAKNWR